MIVFYVSGHGYGHATRAGSIMAALRRLDPSVRIAVRTEAPRWAFPDDVAYYETPVDFKVVESADALSLDIEATRANVRSFCLDLPQTLEREFQWLKVHGAKLLAADIPFLAGALAKLTSIPAVALGNFTWHWILEPLMQGSHELSTITDAYRGFTSALRMPISAADGWAEFPECLDVPLVTPIRSKRTRSEIRRQLGFDSDCRPTILLAGRSSLGAEALRRGAIHFAEADFLTNQSGDESLPRNVLHYKEDEISFSDALRASTVVFSKLGYSTAAECIAEQKRILHPTRSEFREVEFLGTEVARYVPIREIERQRFVSGEWQQDLAELMQQPFPADSGLDVCGDAVCAKLLLQHLATPASGSR